MDLQTPYLFYYFLFFKALFYLFVPTIHSFASPTFIFSISSLGSSSDSSFYVTTIKVLHRCIDIVVVVIVVVVVVEVVVVVKVVLVVVEVIAVVVAVVYYSSV